MTKDELNKLYKDLEIEKKQIEKELEQYGSKNPLFKGDYDVRVDDLGPSQEDAAQEAAQLEINQAMIDKLETRLKEIISAQERIRAGKYGECGECLAEINPERLKVMPIAALCVDCAQKLGRLS